ncbi:HNH endonuclease [Candidatus Albibeggiatoa sp. nov. NOAA]|uniref:HNH endonuclease n=1 Tax=Candidatus Albibeggiatoa sp. nov. NOAA TaxID=3162724 RepID=UPI0032F1C767|nr:HNH endonuclease [Thiotrichaceae bacterium]
MSKTYISTALRKLVSQRAQDICEYCLMPEIVSFSVHHIDHIIAEKHGGETEESNLALACLICNKHKGSDIASIDPETQNIVPLFHPRNDIWTAHFRLENNGKIEGLTAIGRVTAKLLKFNTVEKMNERFLWQGTELQQLVEHYLNQR